MAPLLIILLVVLAAITMIVIPYYIYVAIVVLIGYIKYPRKISKQEKQLHKWYGTTWMSCTLANCYQVHNYGPYKSWLWAFIKAKMCAMDLAFRWRGEDSGIYYQVSDKWVTPSYPLGG